VGAEGAAVGAVASWGVVWADNCQEAAYADSAVLEELLCGMVVGEVDADGSRRFDLPCHRVASLEAFQCNELIAEGEEGERVVVLELLFDEFGGEVCVDASDD